VTHREHVRGHVCGRPIVAQFVDERPHALE